jgi:hypothetical protein
MTRQELIEAILEGWIQSANKAIARKGHKGIFRAEARRKGYSDTLEYARAVKSGKVSGNKRRAALALSYHGGR